MLFRFRRCGEYRKLQWRKSKDDKFKTLSLGRVSDVEAAAVVRALELGQHSLGHIPLSKSVLQALARYGFIPEVRSSALGEFLDTYCRRYVIGKAENTKRNMAQLIKQLKNFFGHRDVKTISTEDADRWWAWRAQNASSATLNREVKRVRQIFRKAHEYGLVTENPFRHLRAGSSANPERFEFVDLDRCRLVLDACGEERHAQQWRTAFTLARFGGVRVHTELVSLEWERHIDLDAGVIRVPRCKTKARKFPLWPEIRQQLENEPNKTGYVIKHCRVKSNLDSGLKRIIRNSGVKRWSRLWHNPRASRQNELLRHGFARPDVCFWMGNSEDVAREHYEHELDMDLAKAIKTVTMN